MPPSAEKKGYLSSCLIFFSLLSAARILQCHREGSVPTVCRLQIGINLMRLLSFPSVSVELKSRPLHLLKIAVSCTERLFLWF